MTTPGRLHVRPVDFTLADSLGKKANAAANLALMLVSGLVGLVIVELALRHSCGR